MINVLAIDTATLCGSVAIGRITESHSEVVFAKQWLRQRSHGELLTASLDESFKVSGIKASDVDFICLDIGPGSFTGVRVGLATARALGYGLKKPILTFSSLQLLAEQVPLFERKLPLVCLLNAHKNQTYAARFIPGRHGWRQTSKPRSLEAHQITKWITKHTICVGEGYDTLAESLKSGPRAKLKRYSQLLDYPSAATMVRLAAKSSIQKAGVSWEQLEALYIRGSEAEEKLKAGVLKPLPSF